MPQPRGSRIPPETQREIVRLYTEEGLTTREIAPRVHWCASAVLRILHAQEGVELRPRRRGQARAGDPMHETRERIAEMYRSGLSTNMIAAHLGIQRTTVAHHLRRAGVEVRGRAESQHLRRAGAVALEGALTARQLATLQIVEREGPVTTTLVARRLRLSSRTTATLDALDALESLGLVAGRRPSGPGAGVGAPKVWRRTNLSTRDVLARALNPSEGRVAGDTMLPIEPFRELIRGLIEREERRARFLAVGGDTLNAEGEGPKQTVAFAMGVTERVTWRWLNGQRMISLTSADRALQAFDGGVTVYDLWPELAADEELDAA